MALSRYANVGSLTSRGAIAAQTLREVRRRVGDQARLAMQMKNFVNL